MAKNGDYCGESAVTYDQVCALDSPCKAPFLAQKSFREQVFLKSTFTQHKPFSSTILESLFLLSLRALRGKAWQFIKSIQPYTKSLESTFSKVDSRGNALLSPFLWLIGIAPRPSIRPLLFAPCSNFSKTNALFAAAKLMDCRATASALARNDRNNATFQSIASLEKVDSRSKAQPTHHDSKHCSGALHSIPKPKHHRRQDF